MYSTLHPNESLWQILGLEEASYSEGLKQKPDEIHRAYKVKALAHHPDKRLSTVGAPGTDSDQFAKIEAAYRALTVPLESDGTFVKGPEKEIRDKWCRLKLFDRDVDANLKRFDDQRRVSAGNQRAPPGIAILQVALFRAYTVNARQDRASSSSSRPTTSTFDVMQKGALIEVRGKVFETPRGSLTADVVRQVRGEMREAALWLQTEAKQRIYKRRARAVRREADDEPRSTWTTRMLSHVCRKWLRAARESIFICEAAAGLQRARGQGPSRPELSTKLEYGLFRQRLRESYKFPLSVAQYRRKKPRSQAVQNRLTARRKRAEACKQAREEKQWIKPLLFLLRTHS